MGDRYVVTLAGDSVAHYELTDTWVHTGSFSNKMRNRDKDKSFNVISKLNNRGITKNDIDFIIFDTHFNSTHEFLPLYNFDVLRDLLSIMVISDARNSQRNNIFHNFLRTTNVDLCVHTIDRKMVATFNQKNIKKAIFMPEVFMGTPIGSVDANVKYCTDEDFNNKIPVIFYTGDLSATERLNVICALIQNRIPCSILDVRNSNKYNIHNKSGFKGRHYCRQLMRRYVASINQPRLSHGDFGQLVTRVYEITLNGSCLFQYLLSETSGFHYFFKDTENCVVFKDNKDLVEKAEYYLKNLEVTKQIAKNALKLYDSNGILYPRTLRRNLVDYLLHNKELPDYAYCQ